MSTPKVALPAAKVGVAPPRPRPPNQGSGQVKRSSQPGSMKGTRSTTGTRYCLSYWLPRRAAARAEAIAVRAHEDRGAQPLREQADALAQRGVPEVGGGDGRLHRHLG